MPKFRGLARDVTFYMIIVEATDEEEARELVKAAEVDEFTMLDDGVWETEYVEEIEDV